MENISALRVLSGNNVDAISLRLDGVCEGAKELVGHVIHAGLFETFIACFMRFHNFMFMFGKPFEFLVLRSTDVKLPTKRGFINEEHHIAFRLTSFGNENAAGESSGSAGAAASEALDEEEDELNSLLRERRRWIEERRASDTNGSVLIKQICINSWGTPEPPVS